jgi:hypothetical protein
MSELNLMELAATQRAELQFDKYRRDLEDADFTPQLRVTYLLYVGRGYHALGQDEDAVPYLERAVEMASQHGLNALLFEAEAALADAARRRRFERTSGAPQVDREVQSVIDAIQGMKHAAGIA